MAEASWSQCERTLTTAIHEVLTGVMETGDRFFDAPTRGEDAQVAAAREGQVRKTENSITSFSL